MSDHYFTAAPASPDERRTLTVRLADRTVDVVSAPGVFSPDAVDKGTSVLLAHAPLPPARGTFLDIGCGWGPITLTLALRSPDATCWAVDVNERALDLTARNAADLGLAGVRTALPDDVPDDVTFDVIWSNPAIRIGKAALHEMLLRWLPRLAPGGDAYLVVQRNLGSDSLHAWLSGALPEGFTTERLTSAKGFRILHVHRAS